MSSPLLKRIQIKGTTYELSVKAENIENVGDLFAANDAMIFKGTLGSVNGTVAQLPTSGYSAGWTYKVVDGGTWADELCEVGDMIIATHDGPTTGAVVIAADWAKVQKNVDVFQGATSAAAGARGLVPAPSVNDQNKFLQGDGTWTTPPSASAVSITLTAANWSNNQQIVTVQGILTDETKQLIQPVPASASRAAYEMAAVRATAQAANSITFDCQSPAPAADLTVYIVVTPLGGAS